MCYEKGGERMKAERKSEGNYLKVDYVETNKITQLQIVGDVNTVEFTQEKDGKEIQIVKYQAEVTYEGITDDSPNVWTMNHTSSNSLIDIWGDDTDDWLHKNIPITLSGEGKMKHFKVDELRIK